MRLSSCIGSWLKWLHKAGELWERWCRDSILLPAHNHTVIMQREHILASSAHVSIAGLVGRCCLVFHAFLIWWVLIRRSKFEWRWHSDVFCWCIGADSLFKNGSRGDTWSKGMGIVKAGDGKSEKEITHDDKVTGWKHRIGKTWERREWKRARKVNGRGVRAKERALERVERKREREKKRGCSRRWEGDKMRPNFLWQSRFSRCRCGAISLKQARRECH